MPSLSLGEATAHAEEDPGWIQPWMRQLPPGLAGKTQIKEPLFQCAPPAGAATALGCLIQALLVLLSHGRRDWVIPKCEQDPASIPDVLEALQWCQTWETLGFFLGRESLRGLWM